MKMAANILVVSALAATATASVQFISTAPPPVEIAVVDFKEDKTSWKCPDCTPNEQYVLEQIQQNTKIADRHALATILGNIKQESNFHPDICEGGARVPYDSCHSGGYGLIQWTTEKRYLGLGSFCKKYNCDPSSLEGQTQYMINENQFQAVLPEFEGRGYSIDQYMVPAYYWLGWGIEGNRKTYAYEYANRLINV